jgi:hypothetical protein
MQLQMTDQSVQFLVGIVKDVIVQIQDHYVHANFMVLDMGVEDEETPIILGRPFLNTTKAVICIGFGQVHFQFPDRKVRCHLIVMLIMNNPRRTTIGGDVDPTVKKPSP